jgi:hypothetical protein
MVQRAGRWFALSHCCGICSAFGPTNRPACTVFNYIRIHVKPYSMFIRRAS